MAVDIACDGLEAASKLAVGVNTTWSCWTWDLRLAGIGDTICRMIADSDVSSMVLMLTASGSPGERVSGLSLGADDYLAKPFHFPELVLRVRALARRRPGASARVYRACGIELDLLRHSGPRDGRPSIFRPRSSQFWRRLCGLSRLS